jgi:hypothetical protein
MAPPGEGVGRGGLKFIREILKSFYFLNNNANKNQFIKNATSFIFNLKNTWHCRI